MRFRAAALHRKIRGRLRREKQRARDWSRVAFAFVWRRLMWRTTVIAITGSVGKTTAKECLAAILSLHGRTVRTLNNQNCGKGVPRTIRRLRPWHRYAVIEIGTEKPGTMRRSARLVKPHVAVVLTVAGTHTNEFLTLDDTAAEKASLLDHLARGGTAILNGDDARVRAMAGRVRRDVVMFGRGVDCALVAGAVSANWPQRLNFELREECDRIDVRTQLVGAHWLASALAALAAARACGVPLRAAAAALGKVAPFAARMQPVKLPSGAVVIRDEETGSIETVEAVFQVMRDAQADRRILVFSDLMDVKGNTRKRLRAIGKIAAEVADMVIFVGEHAHHGVRGAIAAGMDPTRCYDVLGLQRAADLLARELRTGDLVFLKGRGGDHLSRIVFAQFGPIGCWKTSCGKRPICDVCDELQPDFDLQSALATAAHEK
jgi:UDP-N-acetylmuramoyl-tripeptide--D-alanyl-D-alanine ligase